VIREPVDASTEF